jgi:hypothetical protein
MTQRLITIFRNLRMELHGTAVHFHSDGMHGEPTVCFDAHCARPALDV